MKKTQATSLLVIGTVLNASVFCDVFLETVVRGTDIFGLIMIAGYGVILAVSVFYRKEVRARLSGKASMQPVLLMLQPGFVHLLFVWLHQVGMFADAGWLLSYLILASLASSFVSGIAGSIALTHDRSENPQALVGGHP